MRTARTPAVSVSTPVPTTTGLAAGAPGPPGSPTSTAVWLLAAVVLRVEVGSELETVVGPAHQSSHAASVPIMLTSITRPVTVSLADITGTLRSATSPALVVPPTAFLTFRRLQPHSGYYWGGWLGLNSGGFLTAVVLLMIVEAKLATVVAPAHEV